MLVKLSVKLFQDVLNLRDSKSTHLLKLHWSCCSEILFTSVINVFREHFLLSWENNVKGVAVIYSYGHSSWLGLFGVVFEGFVCLWWWYVVGFVWLSFVCFVGFFLVGWCLFVFYDRYHQKTILTELLLLWLSRNNHKNVMVTLRPFCSSIIAKEIILVKQVSRSRRFSLSCEWRVGIKYILLLCK